MSDDFEVLYPSKDSHKKILAWTRGVPFEQKAMQQIYNIANLDIIHKWVAVMPDVHFGKGAPVGSVVPTIKAIIPSVVGVDIGCGMMAVRTDLKSSNLPDNLINLRFALEARIPHGRTGSGDPKKDLGAWKIVPDDVAHAWQSLSSRFKVIVDKYPVFEKVNSVAHLGTLGSGNHFFEICLDEEGNVWFMVHSGSRGVGNRIGSYFTKLAKKDMGRYINNLPDKNLAYLSEGTDHYDDYIFAVSWAQEYARINREIMMKKGIRAVMLELGFPFGIDLEVIDCHHNYVAKEHHYGDEMWITRKGAISAQKDELGIVPGSMGACSFIVKGLGNPKSFCSCSHGAGRVMSRKEAKDKISLKDHIKSIEHVECSKRKSLLDESPKAYKNIEQVMAAQSGLVEIVHTLKQVVCIKGE